MKKNLKMTPEGTKDFLFAECSAMDYICTSIEKVFVKGGFKRVITPALEFYDVFSIPSSGISQESMFKTTDNKGRLLVARPDSTLPIARMVSIESKNYSALNNLLDKLKPCKTVSAIRSLPSLFGGEEVFDEAYDICKGTGAENALDYLHTIYKELSVLELGNKLIIDLGLVQRNDYYTGIVFSGYINGIGDAVISGGRYDDLLSEFDAPMGAAGFAIDTDAITMKHLSDDDVNYSDNPDVLVFAENGHEMKALRYVDELNEKGINAQFSVLETLEETEQFAKSRGIAEVESI